MITLNEIAYNIKNLAYGGKNSTENNISIQQIKHWIHYHRAKICAEVFRKKGFLYDGWTQSFPVTTRNASHTDVMTYENAWLLYDKGITTTAPIPTTKYVENLPKNSEGKLAGMWVAYSSMTASENNYDQSWRDAQRRDQYGYEIQGSNQNRGDFRNYGHIQSYIPKPIYLGGKALMKNVRYRRDTFFADDPNTEANEGSAGQAHRYVYVYSREANNHEANKFTGGIQTYYEVGEVSPNRADLSHHRDSRDLIPRPETQLTLQNLQTSPNYFSGKNLPQAATSGDKKILWRYGIHATAVLENPTDISMIRDYIWGAQAHDYNFLTFDDDKDAYPIPMEYVSDLVQRVIQIEVQTELKTTADEITDGLDDRLRMKGSWARVQK
jgi:hypothetical protein